ncbi:ATP-binding cassette domain-containing protein [Paenarthrobacter sp. NPDC089322]|uniref:sulfate/molybdate ABC transporter ATP-binding protein n=1 Tax=Paenarthrobacter sp. NPDC089322 TaxID=3155065 RepID=UPI00343A5C1A
MTFELTAHLPSRNFDMSVTLAEGQTVAILGPNGAGKSTLLGVIAGLLRPESGSARIGNRELFNLDGGTRRWSAPHLRGTALLAQDALLFPHLNVLDNVAFGPRSKGTPHVKAREVARHWLTEVDALDLAARKPAQLSGGQAQRVAVARALAAEPELLLLDEPMAALDIHAAPLLRRVLKRVLQDRKAIIVTHDVLDAYMLADRVIVVEDGRIAEEGPTREVLERPRSHFAAGLAGLNLVSGTITEEGVTTPDGRVFAGQHDPEWSPRPGQAAVAAFPPSAVSVFLGDVHGSPRNSFPVTITDLEPHGDQIRVRSVAAGADRAGGSTQRALSADITPAASADLGLAPGMQVRFVVKSALVSIYPG